MPNARRWCWARCARATSRRHCAMCRSRAAPRCSSDCRRAGARLSRAAALPGRFGRARAHTEIAVFDAATTTSQALDALRRVSSPRRRGRLRCRCRRAARLGECRTPADFARHDGAGRAAAADRDPAGVDARGDRARRAGPRTRADRGRGRHGGPLLGTVTLADLRDAVRVAAARPGAANTTAVGLAAAGYWAAVAALIQSSVGAFVDAKAPR